MKAVLLILSSLFVTLIGLRFAAQSYAVVYPAAAVSPVPEITGGTNGKDCTDTDLGCIPNDPVGFVRAFYGLGLSLLAGVSLLVLVIGGLIILSSQGNPEKLQKGKEYVYFSLAGLVLAMFGFVFVQFIAGSILKIPGFS